MKKFLYLILVVFFAVSCEKNIELDLPDVAGAVVVDGYVENGIPPYILLSKSEPYFDPIGQSSLNNLPLRGALVYLSNGTDTVLLTEIDTVINGVQTGGFYVALDSNTFLPTMVGEPGTTYSLRILTPEGAEVSATALLPPPVPLDSTWYLKQEELDSLGWGWARLSDPDTLGNNYRLFAKRLHRDPYFLAPFGSAFEDKFINGESFNFAFSRGSLLNSSAEEDNSIEAGFFKRGDTIVVKFCAVDRATFEFWRDAENQLGSNGSPFAVPSNIKSNIKGGRGLFATYTATFDTIIAN